MADHGGDECELCGEWHLQENLDYIDDKTICFDCVHRGEEEGWITTERHLTAGQ